MSRNTAPGGLCMRFSAIGARILDFDRIGGQMAGLTREHQSASRNLIRDGQFAIDLRRVFAPPEGLLKRACAIGRRRDALPRHAKTLRG